MVEEPYYMKEMIEKVYEIFEMTFDEFKVIEPIFRGAVFFRKEDDGTYRIKAGTKSAKEIQSELDKMRGENEETGSDGEDIGLSEEGRPSERPTFG